MKNFFKTAIVSLVFLPSCVTIHKAKDVLDKHPGDAAEYCATKFPNVDSAGAPIFINNQPKNESYQAKIDSLFDLAAELANKIYQDSVKHVAELAGKVPADTNKLAQDLVYYRQQAKTLADQVARLKSAYKPCLPDTIIKPVYLTNTAKLDAALFKIADLEKQLAVAKDHDETSTKKAKNRGWIMWTLVTAIAAGIYLRIKGIL